MTGLCLLLSCIFFLQLPEAKLGFFSYTLVILVGLSLFDIPSSIKISFIQDAVHIKNFIYSLSLSVSWIFAILLATKAGQLHWFFTALDRGTLLWFSLLGFFFLFQLSAKTIVYLALAIWILNSFYYMAGYIETSELYTIISFWLFTTATIKGIIQQSSRDIIALS